MGETGVQINKSKRQWEHGVMMRTVQVAYKLFAFCQPHKE